MGLQPLGRGLGAHLLHPRHVVHGVSHEREVIHDPRGRHAKALLHRLRIRHLHRAPVAAHGVDEHHLIADQLSEVFVSSGNHGSHALRPGLRGQGANHVIGLQAIDHHQGPAQCPNGIKNGGHLQSQVIGHGRSVGLVLGIDGVPKGGALGVEDTGDEIGGPLLTNPAQHVDDAGDGPGGRATATAQVWHGMEGPIDKTRGIHQQKGWHIHGPIMRGWLR